MSQTWVAPSRPAEARSEGSEQLQWRLVTWRVWPRTDWLWLRSPDAVQVYSSSWSLQHSAMVEENWAWGFQPAPPTSHLELLATFRAISPGSSMSRTARCRRLARSPCRPSLERQSEVAWSSRNWLVNTSLLQPRPDIPQDVTNVAS